MWLICQDLNILKRREAKICDFNALSNVVFEQIQFEKQLKYNLHNWKPGLS